MSFNQTSICNVPFKQKFSEVPPVSRLGHQLLEARLKLFMTHVLEMR